MQSSQLMRTGWLASANGIAGFAAGLTDLGFYLLEPVK
jgi:hypothetical protein